MDTKLSKFELEVLLKADEELFNTGHTKKNVLVAETILSMKRMVIHIRLDVKKKIV